MNYLQTPTLPAYKTQHSITCVPIRLWLKKLGYALMLAPHLKPGSILYLAPRLELALDALRAVSAVLILTMYVFREIIKKNRLSPVIAVISLFEITLFISTWYNAGEYWKMFVSIGSIISMCMLMELMLMDDPRICFDVTLGLLEILVYVNLVTILLYPNGMYRTQYYWQNWLLGYDNEHISYILPACILTLVRANYMSGKQRIPFRSWVLLLASFASTIIVWSASSVVGLMILALFILFPWIFKATKILNCRNYVILSAVMFVGIVLLRLQEYFAFFIVDVLGKDLTLTTRTTIWDWSLLYFAEHPILGIGVHDPEELMWMIKGHHAHNIYLDLLLSGGLLHFSCFVVLLALITSKLMKYMQDRMSQIISCGIFIILVLGIGSRVMSHQYFILYICAYHVDKIVYRKDELHLCVRS